MITKLRCNNIKLPIETGRWPNTLREERICHLCNVGLGTEFHFLFECTSADVQSLNFMHNISIGILPSSPYVIKFGVVVLTPKIFLQNCR
jgi:hypothetical protein